MTPRLVIAATHSGAGKTTVATGLMAAMRSRGTRVAAAKIGPDYIDPGYHALATGRPGRNLDAWMCGLDAMPDLARRAARDSDLLVIEGVMGLFDGAADGTASSTAEIAKALAAPVVLVVDAASMSASVAALVHGFRDHDRDVDLAGVILNRVGSETHRQMLLDAMADIDVPVLGCLLRDDSFAWRDRHLGLIPIAEQHTDVTVSLDRLAEAIAQSCDLGTIERIAAGAPALVGPSIRPAMRVGRARVALATGAAFSFTYEDNVEALTAAGAEVVPFNPLIDEQLPSAIDGLVVGGGFPEVYATRLAANLRLRSSVRSAVDDGLVTWAECGGLLWLCESLDGAPLVGAVAAQAEMTSRLTLGYRTVTAEQANPVLAAGGTARGHEFHYSQVTPRGEALSLASRFGTHTDGFATPTLLATYVHLHLGADPVPAERFVAACAARRALPPN